MPEFFRHLPVTFKGGIPVIEITLDGETYSIVKKTKTITDEDGAETEETVWMCNGEEVDAADITEALDDMDTTGYANGQTPERDEEVQIRIHRDRASYSEVELVFYRYDSSQCLTTLNGVSTVFVDREQVVDLVDMIGKMVR